MKYFILTTISIACITQAYAAPKLHPLKAACVTYQLSGQMQNGSTTRCHRKHAYEQYETQNITIGIAGFTQTQHQHTITIGDTIYAIDLEKNTGTKTKNPMYESIMNGMQDKDPEEMSDAFFTSMGFTATDNHKTIAGHQCQEYNSAQLGTVCLTDKGLMLEQNVMGNVTTATDVSIGDSGDEANYELYKNVPITEGPNLSNGFDMESLQNLMNQSN